MLTDVLDDVAAVSALAAEWDELAVEAGRPLSSPQWLLGWWRHAAPAGARLRVVTVREDGGLLGLAPCFVVPSTLRARRYAFLGAGTSLRSEVLARPGREDDVAGAAAAALAGAQPAPGLVLFDGVPAGADALARAWPGRGAWAARRFSVPAPFVRYDAPTYEDWFATRSRTVRQRDGRNRRGLEREGARYRFSTAESAAADLAAFIDLHRARWNTRGGSGVLTPAVERMVLDAAPAMVAAGRLRVWCVDAEGRPINVQLFLSAGPVLSYWLGGFDEAWGRRQPAITALFVLLEATWGDGYQRLDLGGGPQEYKFQLAEESELLHWDSLVPRGPRSAVARAEVVPTLARRVVGSRLSPEVKDRIKRVVPGLR